MNDNLNKKEWGSFYLNDNPVFRTDANLHHTTKTKYENELAEVSTFFTEDDKQADKNVYKKNVKVMKRTDLIQRHHDKFDKRFQRLSNSLFKDPIFIENLKKVIGGGTLNESDDEDEEDNDNDKDKSNRGKKRGKGRKQNQNPNRRKKAKEAEEEDEESNGVYGTPETTPEGSSYSSDIAVELQISPMMADENQVQYLIDAFQRFKEKNVLTYNHFRKVEKIINEILEHDEEEDEEDEEEEEDEE
jgi:hypothetical protein